MSSSRDGIYEAGIVDPGVPQKPYTQPFWLTEPSKLATFRSPWLDQAEIVVIGSGMTSVSLCRSLFSKRPNLRIVVIEARELCSGATGRNGGHCKAMSPGVWYDRKEQYGIEEALRVMQYEHSHLDRIAACAKENDIDCDLRFVEGLDIYYDAKILKRATDALKDMRKYSPELAERYKVYTSAEDLKVRNLAHPCLGAIGIRAGTLWPYKFVTGLFEKMVDHNNLSIQTNTTVTSITDNVQNDFATVQTTRGSIKARHVIHATNSWLGHLLHELRPYVSPVRANVQRQRPITQPKTLSNYSFWLRYGEKEYDYLIQRPDKSYILGRANTGRRATTDDNTTDLIPQAHLRYVTPRIFDLGAEKLSVTHSWSGAVAFTEDANPFVGRLPFKGREHQWVCGAYQGIGMVRAFRCAEMLACLVLREEVSGEYPRSMLLTEERVKILKRLVGGKL